VCEGTGEVVYDVTTGREIPFRCATSEFVVIDGETDSQQRYSEPMGCLECEKGCAVLPSVYQPFKWRRENGGAVVRDTEFTVMP